MLLPVGRGYRKSADARTPDLHNALFSRFHILRCGYKSRKIRSRKLSKFPIAPTGIDIHSCAAVYGIQHI